MAGPTDGASSISVAVRVRPFTIREAAQLTKCDDGPMFLGDGSLAGHPPKLAGKGIRSVIKVVDDRCLVFDPPEDSPMQRFSRSVVPNGKRVKDQTFCFDKIFDENVSQGDVYEATTKSLLDSVLDGYNSTVFAYGATGCGKTHTITGTSQAPGIIFLTMQELFERISERSEEKSTEVSLSYLEIYNETIRDLLVPGGSKIGLMLREDSHQTVSVSGLSSHHPENVQDVMDLIMRGNECRTMSPTEANATSSRSHAVLQINLAQKDRNASVNEPHTMATLSIIDLAGSERASATKNRGERLIEGANINKSLLALGSCINALCDPRKRNHVPYRNSKLTRLLKFSLGGNCRTVMIVCISPSSQHYDETQNTLRYANRAKNIQTKVTRNVYNVNRHVKDYLVKIDEQISLINELRQQQKDYEATAFTKFRKQNEKKQVVAREGIARLRNAYENSAPERQEKINHMRWLRGLERRISMVSSWVAAFDSICDSVEDEEPIPSLSAMRKTAQGVLFELEQSRHHYNQRLMKSNWERALDSALQTGLHQLEETDGAGDGNEFSSSLAREAELLKANAEREALATVAEQEKSGDGVVVQVLLQANFETLAAINNMLHMSEEEAVSAAKSILGKILSSCSDAASYVVKPDNNASIVPVEAFPPTRSGTPKRKKSINPMAGSPIRRMSAIAPPSLSYLNTPPVKASPRRLKIHGARKGITVSFTPKKKSPRKKRAVRWRDDEEDGTLAEYEKTPQRQVSSPVKPSPNGFGSPATMKSSLPLASNSIGNSSPISASLESSLPMGSKNDRFKAGFLSKKTSGSPLRPTITNFSDSDHSPLRDIEPSKAMNRTSLQLDESPDVSSASIDSGNNSGTEDGTWKVDKSDAIKIKTAVKRASLYGAIPAIRVQRRRSPSGLATTGSPPGDNVMFTASHARRMVKGDKENDWKTNVLSPRTAPVLKNGRRVASFGEGKPREVVRVASGTHGSGGLQRGSLVTSKNAWR